MESFGKLSESSSLLTPTADSPVSPPASGHANICNSCGSNTGLERLDASKLNQLLDHVRTRLSSDFYGNLFIEGGNLAKDKRHGDLGELFNLMAKLDSFKASMDKYIELHTHKEAPKPEKPGKLNENMSAMVRNVVESQVEARFRDLTIRCERLEEQLKNSQSVGNEKVGKAKQANSVKIAEVELKVDDNRKAAAKEINEIKKAMADEINDNNEATAYQLTAVRRDLVKLDQACRAKNAANTEEFASLWTRDHVVRDKINELRAERSGLQEQIDDNAKDIERVTRDLAEVEDITLATNTQQARLMHRMDRVDRGK
ncbi:hypothetical protein KC332_g11782 [Hortaea werneckii]|nr:hypothetical protein KC358_g15793 [Hortaea werneckii]KAI6814638.1 hypothetical protein KC350_g11251 [Hortaea werneckii]KAI6920123.1 hypothetical protein KC348_g10474 [Hortaea werneckii]KAI6930552.1 hypothetical protein KC341_g10154 [Hortaea werneckii]KAI6961540.1 hypothetical protein KC321_g12265 [Hortaea werneckii]